MDAVDPVCVCYWHYTDGIQTHQKKQGHTVPSVTYFVWLTIVTLIYNQTWQHLLDSRHILGSTHRWYILTIQQSASSPADLHLGSRLVADVKFLKWNLYIFEVLITELIIELICKLQDEFIKIN